MTNLLIHSRVAPLPPSCSLCATICFSGRLLLTTLISLSLPSQQAQSLFLSITSRCFLFLEQKRHCPCCMCVCDCLASLFGRWILGAKLLFSAHWPIHTFRTSGQCTVLTHIRLFISSFTSQYWTLAYKVGEFFSIRLSF